MHHTTCYNTVKLASLMLFNLIYFTLNAQPTNNYIGEVSMISPNAASIGKFGDYPVDKSTGVPSISIPLHNSSYAL